MFASSGSEFVYSMLFVMVLAGIALAVVQEMCARLGAYTGEGLISLVREQFSLRMGAFAVFALLVANLGLVVSEFAGIGAAMEIFGVSRYISVPIAAAVIFSLVVLGSYQQAERIFLLLSLVFLVYPISMVLADPDWGQVAANTVWPHFDGTQGVPLPRRRASSARRSRRTCSCTRRRPSPTAGSAPTSTPQSGPTRSSAPSSPTSSRCRSSSRRRATIGGSGPLTSASDAAQALEPVAGAGAETLFAIGPARRVAARGRGGPAVDGLRRRRGGRRGALGVAAVPRGAAVPRPVHRAGGDRRGRRARAGEPHLRC